MEAEFIHWLRDRLPSHPQLLLGPGDDAAVLRLTRQDGCVVTSDLLNDGVDFRLEQCDPRLIGRKALAVNLSDLAAMAARPVAALVSLLLPRTGALSLAQQLFEGLLPLAEEFHIAIAGGDTNTWDGRLVICLTAIGEVTGSGPLRRAGALPGDEILVTGHFGGSLLGKHLQFTPRVQEALKLHAQYQLHAGTDVSDGLSLDLWNIVSDSGCGALLDLAAIPIDAAACRLAADEGGGRSPLDHALGDGEDFELILAASPEEARRMLQDQPLGTPLTRIETFIAEPGLWTRSVTGLLQRIEPRGWRH
jgi:thiamine-monophosphate kinase